MTALLSCDGCATIVSERPEDDDPTSDWWCLTKGPIIGGGGLFPTIKLSAIEDFDTEPEYVESSPPELARHFCCEACIGAWLSRR